ncbi:hypothetical protein SAMN04489723_10841 [Algoriphagus aquimarinus]|uniref:Uncharacterized protein n=1 Tax=Algoriphagus aquimarinus TaxID=237018 RepID=A0A1I1AHV5_9BACT|nr:hypothetical protein SAMN04489723_10841 [Algoriphagus aquimarinus]
MSLGNSKYRNYDKVFRDRHILIKVEKSVANGLLEDM